MLINPIIRTRTRLINSVYHPTRHNIDLSSWDILHIEKLIAENQEQTFH
jgi:hypothetical protein